MKASLLKDILLALDQKLNPPYDLDTLANEIGYSKYHLCRAFHAATGEGLITYMRRLTLSRSAASLRAGRSVLDVAVAHGYQSQEAYHRAFVKMFGLTPAAFQRGQAHHSLWLKRSWNEKLMPIAPPETYSTELEAFSLWGMGSDVSYDDFDALITLWENFHQHIPRSRETFGVTAPLPDEPNKFRYYAAIPQPSDLIGLKPLSIPKQKYQVFLHRGTAAGIMQTLNYIWGTWLPSQRVTVAGIDFERYAANYDPSDPKGEVEMYIPVK